MVVMQFSTPGVVPIFTPVNSDRKAAVITYDFYGFNLFFACNYSLKLSFLCHFEGFVLNKGFWVKGFSHDHFFLSLVTNITILRLFVRNKVSEMALLEERQNCLSNSMLIFTVVCW